MTEAVRHELTDGLAELVLLAEALKWLKETAGEGSPAASFNHSAPAAPVRVGLAQLALIFEAFSASQVSKLLSAGLISRTLFRSREPVNSWSKSP